MKKIGFYLSIIIISITGCKNTVLHQKDVIPDLPMVWKNNELNAKSTKVEVLDSEVSLLNTKKQNQKNTHLKQQTIKVLHQNDVWWGVLQDTNLNTIVIKALAANADLKQAAIRLKQAKLKYDVSKQSRYPNLTTSVTGSFSAITNDSDSSTFTALTVPSTTTSNSGTTSQFITETAPSPGLSKNYSITHSLQYEVDVWSRLADQRISDRWDVEATKADEDVAKISLISDVITHYWNIALIDYKLPLLQADIVDAEKMKDIADIRVKNKLQIPSMMKDAIINLEQKKAQLDRLKRDRLAELYTLAVLMNVPPQTLEIATASIPNKAIHLPGLKAGTPASILQKRPDLHSAWLHLNQALYQVHAAEKARYPSISLSGNLTSNVQSLKDIISNPLGSLALNLSLPLIDWSRLNMDVKNAKLQYESSVIGFRSTLYKALVEVENAMENLQANRIALSNAQLAYNSAITKESLAHLRYTVGTKDKESWMSEQANKRNSYTSLVQSRITLFESWIQLGKALGGYDYLNED